MSLVLFIEVPSTIEEVVSGTRHYLLLKALRSQLGHHAIVELEPRVRVRVLAVGRVMAATHVTVVIGHAVKIIY